LTHVDAPQTNRIFIVDDHPLIRRVLRQVLCLADAFDVVGEAVSGEDALEQLSGQAPDLILVDFSLPGMDGAELVRQLTEKHPHLCCIVVSSHHEPLYAKLALDAGASGYVTKGDPEALIGAIGRVLNGETVVDTGC